MNRDSKGFLAAGLGLSCCVLPLVLIVAGLGGSLLTVFLVKYKTYLMTLAVLALLYSWSIYARDARECATRLCEIAGGRFRKWMLGANTAVVVFFLIITYTPAGALVGVDFQGESVIAANVAGQSAPAAKIPPLALPAFAKQTADAAPAGMADGATRMERLSLRVEGMS
jgi:hypothetical protein